MEGRQNATLIAELERLVAAGLSLRRAGIKLGIGTKRPYSLLRDRPELRVRRRIDEQTVRRVKRLISGGRLSYARIAIATSVSKTSVLRIRDRAAGVSNQWRRRRVAYRCAGCRHLVSLDPCPICEARRANATSNRPHASDA